MIKPWQKISSEPVGNFRIFTIRSDKKISPRTQREHDFYVIDSVHWVNVVAVTPDQQLVDGLKVIGGQIDEMAGQLAQGDLDALSTRGRYLEIKYQGDTAGV